VTELVAARIADVGSGDLGPLAPHVVVASEGFAGTLAQSFDGIITKYAGAANFVRFTGFELEEFDGPAQNDPDEGALFWELNGFNISAGSATAMDIASLPAGTTDVGLGVGLQPLATSFSPETTSADNISLIANYTQAMQASAADRQASYDAALRIENPLDNSPNTIDCASCHMAQPARQLVGAVLGMTASGDPNAFVPDASIPVADLAQTTQLVEDGDLNIHAFSYLPTGPMINQRAINETAANLAYIATLLP
jgi:hypothetical protein